MPSSPVPSYLGDGRLNAGNHAYHVSCDLHLFASFLTHLLSLFDSASRSSKSQPVVMLLPTLAAWLLCLFPVTSAQDAVAAQSAQASAMKSAVADITPGLSKGAVITLPFQKRWVELQVRGSSPRVSPAYTAVVEVATEQDVATVVTVANRYNIPFLAVSGTHGWTKTLNNLPYGIQIRMRKLDSTTVSRDGKTAVVQGGVLQYEITRALFAQGKYAGK